jgi:membrane-associated phospholipid phosphatase
MFFDSRHFRRRSSMTLPPLPKGNTHDSRWNAMRVCLAVLTLSGCQTTTFVRLWSDTRAAEASVRQLTDRPATSAASSSTVLIHDDSIADLKITSPFFETSPKPKTFCGKPHKLTTPTIDFDDQNSPWLSLIRDDIPEPGSTDDMRFSRCRTCDRNTCVHEHDAGRFCFRCDAKDCWLTLWEDTRGVVNWNNALILGVAAGGVIAMREGDADREVREWVNQHPERWGEGTHVLGIIGEVQWQAPALVGLYAYSLWSQDEELHDVSGSLLSAFTITSVTTTVIKFVANTDRPSTDWNDGHYGFPSYHTSSSFAIAAVLDEYYGPAAGLPAYALAGLIGFSRVDEQDHDLSDVFFGSVLGFVIGKSVAGRHLCGDSRVQLLPYIHPTDGSSGVALETRF